MLLDEGKTASMLQREYKHGYSIIVDEDNVTVMTESWMIAMERSYIPRKVLGALVEHMGTLPQAPASMKVIKGGGNQELLWDVAAGDIEAMRKVAHATPGYPTELIYRGFAIWQSEDDNAMYGARAGYLKLLETPEREAMILDGSRLMWNEEGQRLIVLCSRPYSGIMAERWKVLESADWLKKE